MGMNALYRVPQTSLHGRTPLQNGVLSIDSAPVYNESIVNVVL